MINSESLVLKTRDDMPKGLFGNVLQTLYLKGLYGFGSTCKHSETLAREEDTCISGSTSELTETLAKEKEVVEDTNNQVTEHSASDLSLNDEQDVEVADGSLIPLSDEPGQKEVANNHDRPKPDFFYGPYRKSAAKPFTSVIVIALCMLCVLPGTKAFKAHLGYNQFDDVLGKPGRSPLPNESIINPDAKKLQASDELQPVQQNAYEEAGRKNGDYQNKTEESRERRGVEEAIPNKKGEPQQEVRTERQMVASTPSSRDVTRDEYEVVEHIIKREGNLSINIIHNQDEKDCSLTTITNMTTKEYSSKEKQDGIIIVERSDTFCIFHFKNFTLESYVNTTVYADADMRRILHPDLFLNRLNDRIAVYHSNDQEGTVTISTVGENVKCSIQPTSVVEHISAERGNIVTTLYIKYKKAGVCFYNINCNMSGFIHSITHEVENCSAQPTATTQLSSHSGVTDHSTSTNNDSTTTPINITTTKPSKRDGTSSKHYTAAIIGLAVFGVLVVIAFTVLYIMKKKTINHWLRINIEDWHRILIEHCCMLCRSTSTHDNGTADDRRGDQTQKPLRKPESNDSGIELAGQSTVLLPDQ